MVIGHNMCMENYCDKGSYINTMDQSYKSDVRYKSVCLSEIILAPLIFVP